MNINWHIEQREVFDLKTWEDNPRQISDESMEKLKQRILDRGFHGIITIDADNTILSGNQRKEALLQLGITQVPCCVPDRPLTKQERELVALESNHNDGVWVPEMLANFNEDDLLTAGFTQKDLEGILHSPKSKDNDDEIPQNCPPVATVGDIWQLGEHRVICGDATNVEHVKRLMNEKMADMVFTDPPYNVDYSGRGENTSNTILNDKMTPEQFDEFLRSTFKNYAEVTKGGGAWYVFHSSSTQHQFQKAIELAGWNIKNQIIWNKPTASMGWGDYRWKHEPMFYCGKEGTIFYGDRTNSTVLDFTKTEEEMIEWVKKIKRAESRGKTTIWTMKRDSVNEYVHPTQKPVELIQYALHNSSKKDDIVLDLFLGSGATLIACEKTGRICYGMELDPKYVDIIIKRWEDYTNSKAIKL